MGIHKRKPSVKLPRKAKFVEPEKLPNNIGKRRRIPTIWGTHRYMVIEDEILHRESKVPNKLIAFQRIRIEENNRIQYRLGYYMIGVKPRARGRWVWGQFCLMVLERDLKAILRKAERKGWFTV